MRNLIRPQQRISHSRLAMNVVRQIWQIVDYPELLDTTNAWVETTLTLGNNSLQTMDLLVKAETRRSGSTTTLCVGATAS